MLQDIVTGIQHVGLPTNDIEKTIGFYKEIGFEVVHRTTDPEANVPVAFLKMKNLVIETYRNGCATMTAGSIDHISLDVSDINSAFDLVSSQNFSLVDSEIQFLPFWENGVRFFTILGPNSEKIEFCQRL